MDFEERNAKFIEKMNADDTVRHLSESWFEAAVRHEYMHHFTWLGLPIIQFPQDIVALQEIIWNVRPDFIVETGIARGGSLIFYASMLELLGGAGKVVGVDRDIRPGNRQAIEAHPLFRRITMIEGSSVAPDVVAEVHKLANQASRALVVLDSNHTHDHVLQELELYSPLVCAGSYLVAMDTKVEHLPNEFYPDRPWGPGNNPLTAVREFLHRNDRFQLDESIEKKLLLTASPGGYLKCVRNLEATPDDEKHSGPTGTGDRTA